MNKDPFVIERTYDAPADQVWQAITDKDQMKQWYFELEEFKPEVGFKFTFVGGSEEKSYLHLCEVVEVIEGKKLKHSWRYDNYEGNSFVTWEIFDEGDKTRVNSLMKACTPSRRIPKTLAAKAFLRDGRRFWEHR
jgi:uncharacterized protein YndB with AHSA1/START domain